MSTLKETLLADMKTAMKEKDQMKKGVVNLIRAGIQNQEIEKKSDLTEEEAIKIVQREMKQTKQSLEEAEKADRQDIVEAEKKKIAIIETYLPKQLDIEEVKALIDTLSIDKSTPMGQVVGAVMKEVGARAEGKVVSQAVKEYLQG